MTETRTVYVVLKLTRGAPDTVAVFPSRMVADKFADRLKRIGAGTYRVDVSTLYHFGEPQEVAR